MKNSFVELNARERVNALLDNGRELIDPFDQIIAPSLLKHKESSLKVMTGLLSAVARSMANKQ